MHAFLSQHTPWARGIDRSRVDRAIDASLCFGVFVDGAQIGFARVITDGATFAYLCDVFVEPAFRGRGVARQLMVAIGAHPELQDLRRFALVTSSAHGLYARFGFTAVAAASNWMDRHRPDVYAGMEQ